MKEDILNSIKIMIKSQLSIRVVSGKDNLFLQSFVGQTDEVEKEQGKLLSLASKNK